MEQFKYYAFISYSRKDEKMAKWLQNAVETYRLPSAIRKSNIGIPAKLFPLFRDKTDLNGTKLKKALYYAAAMEQAQTAGKQKYTCLMLDHYDYDYSDCRSWGSYTKDLLERLCENKKYVMDISVVYSIENIK